LLWTFKRVDEEKSDTKAGYDYEGDDYKDPEGSCGSNGKVEEEDGKFDEGEGEGVYDLICVPRCS